MDEWGRKEGSKEGKERKGKEKKRKERRTRWEWGVVLPSMILLGRVCLVLVSSRSHTRAIFL